MDHIIQNGYELWKKEGFLQNDAIDMLKNDIKGEQETFDDIFERSFELVDDIDKNHWIKTSDVYETFQELNESEFNIKYKLSEKGIECTKGRGQQGQGMYFKGLVKRQIQIIED